MLNSNPFIFIIPLAVIFVVVTISALVMSVRLMSRYKKHHQIFDELQERAMNEMRENDGALEQNFYGTAVIKRTKVNHGPCGPGTTTYFVTFEKEDGDRKELKVSGENYGLIAEGDRGTVIHKGTKLVDFRRDR